MSAQRIAQWLWWSGSAPARAARGVLLPVAFLYRTIMSARARAYARGWLRQRPLPLPSIAIGNLAVGGAGKTPLAAWIAAFFASRGIKPGVLLRGYRGDEQAVHQRLVPDAIVVPNPDRLAGAEKARAQGARVLVLDDAYQRLNVARDSATAARSRGAWRRVGQKPLWRACILRWTDWRASSRAGASSCRHLRRSA
jgi:tetraacyldisaccharide 4'-kinase